MKLPATKVHSAKRSDQRWQRCKARLSANIFASEAAIVFVFVPHTCLSPYLTDSWLALQGCFGRFQQKAWRFYRRFHGCVNLELLPDAASVFDTIGKAW